MILLFIEYIWNTIETFTRTKYILHIHTYEAFQYLSSIIPFLKKIVTHNQFEFFYFMLIQCIQ